MRPCLKTHSCAHLNLIICTLQEILEPLPMVLSTTTLGSYSLKRRTFSYFRPRSTIFFLSYYNPQVNRRHKKKKGSKVGARCGRWCTPSISALVRQGRADLCEVYMVSSQPARSTKTTYFQKEKTKRKQKQSWNCPSALKETELSS